MFESDIPNGFILSDAALYAFKAQDVFPDLISFCAAIPAHLRPLFLIPIQVQAASQQTHIAMKIANEFSPSGETEESDLFSVKTFVNYDNEPTVPTSDPGSIFDIDGPDAMTHHQDLEENQDKNYQVPTDTSYLSDVDITQYVDYPYRTDEKPVRHSSVAIVSRTILHKVALKADVLESHAPKKIKDKANVCSVRLISYDKRGRVFTFNVSCGGETHTVRAALFNVNDVVINCNCEFWKWNGPEFHAKRNRYMLGQPKGTAAPPNVRDPNREYWLCKHAYSVLARLDDFITQVADENHDKDETELLEIIDKDWDELAEEVEVPLEEIEEENIEVEWEEEKEDEEEVEEVEIEEVEIEDAEESEKEQPEEIVEEEIEE